ncbi:hypothetical protein BDW66DRAFT_145131 [Aspergillus desertorum]
MLSAPYTCLSRWKDRTESGASFVDTPFTHSHLEEGMLVPRLATRYSSAQRHSEKIADAVLLLTLADGELYVRWGLC